MSTDLPPVPNVLVVEDEMILRMRAVDIVEDAGFNPVEAVNADEAISILESRSDISLLFTDIQMPGSMDGLKLAHAVHDRWPSIKIILVSGQVQPSDAERPANSRFFGKPLGVEANDHRIAGDGGCGSVKHCSGRNRIAGEQALPAKEPLAVARSAAGGSWRRRTTAFACCSNKPASTPRPCCPGRYRRQGARGGRQIAEADSWGTSPSHQEHSGDRQRNRVPEPPCRAKYRARSEGDGGPVDRAGTGPRSADAGQMGKCQS